MRAVIISGGNIYDYDYIKSFIKQDDYIICADRGYDHAVCMGIKPSILLGDFDSISNVPSDIKIIKFPTKKDLTDTQIAIDYAYELGANDFLLLGVTGCRLDHTLANIYLLKKLLDDGKSCVIIDEHNKISLTDSHMKFYGSPGDIVSIIPASNCYNVTTSGLEYPLNDADLNFGDSLGVSNVMLDTVATINLKKGILLVIQSQD